MGAGNLFRIFIGGPQQDLLEAGLTDTGIIVWEGYDDEIIPKSLFAISSATRR
jgi:fructuronate reductase